MAWIFEWPNKMTYSSLAFSSETLLKLAPFLGRQATNSTSNTSVALAQKGSVSDLFHSRKKKIFMIIV